MCLSKASSTHTLDGHLRVETHEHPRVFGVMETSVGESAIQPRACVFRNVYSRLHLKLFFWCVCRDFILILCVFHAQPFVIVTNPYIFLW